jgi:predicted aldo/keto reductase-like oxidoreductase
LAWVAKNPNTSTVILGASKPEQVTENLKAIEVIPKLTPEVMVKIEEILNNKPEDPVRRSSSLFFLPCVFLLTIFLPAVLQQASFR